MEVLGLQVSPTSVLFVILLVVLYWYGTSTFGTFKKMGVPNRTPLLPYLGSLYSVFLRSAPDDQLFWREQLRCRTFGSFQGRTPTLETTDLAFLKQVTIKQFPKFTNRHDNLEGLNSIVNRNLLGFTNNHWKHVRSLLTPTFTTGKLKQMLPLISSCADKLVGHLRKTSAAPMVIKDYAAGYTMDVIASTGFAMDIDTQSTTNHPFVENAAALLFVPKTSSIVSKFKQTWTLFVILLLPVRVKAFFTNTLGVSLLNGEYGDYFERVIKRVLAEQQSKESKDSNNFISMCADKLVDPTKVDKNTLRVADNGDVWSTTGLTEREIVGNAVVLLLAGYETTSTALQYFFYNMAKHADIQEKLYKMIQELCEESDDGDLSYDQYHKLEYLDWCINESLRIFPPLARIDRLCNEDAVIEGIHIPKGMVVVFHIYAIHHDPEYWADPETYQPERFSPENRTSTQQHAFLPFGSGNRNCIAMRLALLEMRVAIVKAMLTFRFERTAETPEMPKYRLGSTFLLSKDPLKIAAVPRDLSA